MQTMMVIDDEYLVRVGIKETIDWGKHGIKIIGEACDGEEGLDLAIKHSPDIIITDMNMPIMDGTKFISKLRQNGLECGIIILSAFQEFEYARTAVNHGVDAYILKPIDNSQLVETVLNVSQKIKEEKNTKHYYEKLNSELSTIKKKFLIDLIFGNITDTEKIKEKIAFLNIPNDVENNLVIDIKIDKYDLISKELAPEELGNFKDMVEKYISEVLLLHSKYMGVVINSNPDEWVVILHTDKEEEEILSTIKENCKKLASMVEQKSKWTVSIEVSHLYKNTCSFLADKFMSGVNYVMDVKEDIFNYRKEVKEAIAYIKNNYFKDITVEMASKQMFISSSYLMHIFKAEVGKTFSECLIDYRIEKAKELLKDSRYKIYEVSSKVGYKDVKYFSQIFKKITGMSPREYIR